MSPTLPSNPIMPTEAGTLPTTTTPAKFTYQVVDTGDAYLLTCMDQQYTFPKRLYLGEDGAEEVKREILEIVVREQDAFKEAAVQPPVEPKPVTVLDDQWLTGGKTLTTALNDSRTARQQRVDAANAAAEEPTTP